MAASLNPQDWGSADLMSACICGRPAVTFGGLCSRCGALQSLGLGTDASTADIESAYRTLVKVWHPDRFQTDLRLKMAADEKLKEINAAHHFLVTEPSDSDAAYAAAEPEPARRPRPIYVAAEEAPDVATEAAETPQPVPRRNYALIASILFRGLIAVGMIAGMALLWLTADSLLSASPQTSAPWNKFKNQLSLEFHSDGMRLWAGVTERLYGSKTENALPPAAPPVEAGPAAQAKSPAPTGRNEITLPPQQAFKARPYVTSGATAMEVLAALGKPTSSSGEKMFYNGSEIDFRDGHVSAWKIDPKTPIRVKLWSDEALVPGVHAYAIGSSKSDVIALQGTPTLFSDNEFGYGRSIVYFKNDRVVGWKEDPGSVRLRVVAK
jgi:hypothetical protein